MSKSTKAYMKKPYARILIPDEESGKYMGEVLEFPGCFAYGDTPEETLSRLDRAAESWIEAAIKQRQSIPEPFGSAGYSGNFALRIPRSLHRRAARLAERDRVSLNQFFVSAISERVGAEDALNQLVERVNERLNRPVMASITITNNTMQTLVMPATIQFQLGDVLSTESSGVALAPVGAVNG